MQSNLAIEHSEYGARTISPINELAAYEALWDQQGASFKNLADKFRQHPGAVPSNFVSQGKIIEYTARVMQAIADAGITQFGVRVNGAGEYPTRLRDAAHPIELLCYQGWWDLVDTPSVAIVGTRHPSDEGVARARKLVRLLVEDGYTIVSGLAQGIDTIAHTTAIEVDGRTIAVIGTPLTDYYPPENAKLQQLIANEYLLISQVPICRYKNQRPFHNKLFFPERNVTMSALTEATIIVEAGETSGTLIQARAALAQGRKLFILESCFQNPSLTWPAKFEKRGAIRVREYEDIKRSLVSEQVHKR